MLLLWRLLVSLLSSDVQCDSSLFLLEIVGSTKLLMLAGARTKTSVSLITLGLYSLSGKTSYRQISRSLEAARLDVAMVASL